MSVYRKEQLELFFYWINERERIRQAKEAGKPRETWTKDEILQTYKFTNVFRKLDRTTQDMIERVKKYDRRIDRVELYTRIFAFRLFNWTPTYDVLAPLLPNLPKATAALKRLSKKGVQLWTGAYMIHADPGEKVDKVTSYMKTLKDVYKSRVHFAEFITKNQSLEQAVKVLQVYNHVGPFIAYELACDFSYFDTLLGKCTDRYTWANTGPGAARGIHRLLTGSDKRPSEGAPDYLAHMQALLHTSKEMCESHVAPLEMRDIEHSLCEYDKYSRVYFNEGRRPKQKYKGVAA